MSYIKRFGWFYLLVICGAVLLSILIAGNADKLPVWSEQTQPITVVIDPGHGGEDGGAISCTGICESKINLEISLRLKDMLHLLGVETKMIRTQDTAVYTEGETIAQKKVSDIRNRVRMVNETPRALLVSIHQNQFQQEQYRGAQVFYADGSEALAQRLQSSLATQLDPKNHREIKAAKDIYLMTHVNCTAVLVECGFLSNPTEEALLRTEAYQKKMAACIAGTLAGCLEEQNEGEDCLSMYELRE